MKTPQFYRREKSAHLVVKPLILILMAGFFIIIMASLSSAVDQTSLQEGNVLWLNFNNIAGNKTGDVIIDKSAQSNNCTMYDAINCNADNCTFTDNTNCNLTTALGGNDVTYLVWIYLTETQEDGGDALLHNGGNEFIAIYSYPACDNCFGAYNDNVPTTNTAEVFPDGDFYQLIAVHSETLDTLTYYKNGSTNVSGAASSVNNDGTFTTKCIGDNNGKGTMAVDGAYYIVAAWNRTLNASEMDYLYARGRYYTLYGDHAGGGAAASVQNVTLYEPDNNTWTSNLTPQFNFSAISNVSATLNCTLYYNGSLEWNSTSVTNNTPTTFTVGNPLQEGNRSWFISCNDTNGVFNSSTNWLRILNTPPKITSFNIEPATIYTNTSSNANTTANTILGTLQANLSCYVNGAVIHNQTSVALTNNTAYDFSTMGHANYTKDQNLSCNISVWDQAGNSNITTISLNISDSPPNPPTAIATLTNTLFVGMNITLSSSGATDNDTGDSILYYMIGIYDETETEFVLDYTNDTGGGLVDYYINHSLLGHNLSFYSYAVTSTLNSTNYTVNRNVTRVKALIYVYDAESGSQIPSFNVTLIYALRNVSYGSSQNATDNYSWFNSTRDTSDQFVHIYTGGNLTYRLIINANSTTRNYTNYNTTEYFDIFNISGTNITINVSIPPDNALNITFRDEASDVLLDFVNVNYTLISSANASDYGTSTGTDWLTGLTRGIEYEIRYTANGFVTRSYFVNITASTQTITLYLLNQTNATLVTAIVYDDVADFVENATISMLRYYTGCNCYRTVEMSKTNFEGETGFWLVQNTVWYRFNIEYQDEVVYTSGSTRVFDDTITFIVNLRAAILSDFFKYGSLTYSLNISNITFTFLWSDSNGQVNQGCLDIYTVNALGETLFNSSCNSSSSAVVFLNVANVTDTTYKAVGYVNINSTRVILETIYYSFTDVVAVMGEYGLLLTAFIMLVLGFTAIYNPATMLILEGSALIFTRVAGLHNIGWGVIASVIGVIVIIIYIISDKS